MSGYSAPASSTTSAPTVQKNKKDKFPKIDYKLVEVGKDFIDVIQTMTFADVKAVVDNLQGELIMTASKLATLKALHIKLKKEVSEANAKERAKERNAKKSADIKAERSKMVEITASFRSSDDVVEIVEMTGTSTIAELRNEVGMLHPDWEGLQKSSKKAKDEFLKGIVKRLSRRTTPVLP
jgi:hypothetical protein